MKGELTRARAIVALHEIMDRYFGAEKGSQEMYQSFCEDLGLAELWDGEEPLLEQHQPPGTWELLMAIGVTEAELIEHLHANPTLFRRDDAR